MNAEPTSRSSPFVMSGQARKVNQVLVVAGSRRFVLSVLELKHSLVTEGTTVPPGRPGKCWAVLAHYSTTALRSQVAHLSSRWWTYFFFPLWNAIKWCGYKCLDKIKMSPSWIFFLNWQTYSNILAKAWRVLVTYMKNFRFKPSPVRPTVIVCRQRCKIKP